MNERAITRRGFLRASAGAGAGAAAGAALAGPAAGWLQAAASQADRPNVVLILADDFGYECVGADGGTSYRTPNLDKLARTGMRFVNCFCTPLCSPSRIQLMTGRYGFRNYRGWGILDPKEVTFGHMLRSAGYATAVSGKWQLCDFSKPQNADHPRRAGFDESCLWTWDYGGKKPSRYWSPWIWQNGKLRGGLEGRYGPDVHCDYVIDFIGRNRLRPFLAYYALNLAHAPYVPTPDSLPPPGEDVRRGEAGQQGDKRYYGDMVAYLDKCVGRVVESLETLGLRERTLILFTGDNGTPRGITSRMGDVEVPGGKGTMTDAGTHVPLIANWPGRIAPGGVCDELVDFSDFLPTLAEATGTPLPADRPIDGRSFLPLLLGRPDRPRQWAYIHWYEGTTARPGPLHRAVRTKRWKLHDDGRLYDMQADPFEARPFAAGAEPPEAAEARKQLQDVLAGLRA